MTSAPACRHSITASRRAQGTLWVTPSGYPGSPAHEASQLYEADGLAGKPRGSSGPSIRSVECLRSKSGITSLDGRIVEAHHPAWPQGIILRTVPVAPGTGRCSPPITFTRPNLLRSRTVLIEFAALSTGSATESIGTSQRRHYGTEWTTSPGGCIHDVATGTTRCASGLNRGLGMSGVALHLKAFPWWGTWWFAGFARFFLHCWGRAGVQHRQLQRNQSSCGVIETIPAEFERSADGPSILSIVVGSVACSQRAGTGGVG